MMQYCMKCGHTELNTGFRCLKCGAVQEYINAKTAYDQLWATKTELESIIHELKAENKRLKAAAE